MSCETNLLKENNELKREVKKLTNQRKFGDMSGLGFKRTMTKGGRTRAKKIKKHLQLKLSHSMCYWCHEAGHLENDCPNIEKLKKMKEDGRLKHVKCFKCRTWGHLTLVCPTKQLVKQ
jgi:predicted RNase H-like nuclease (RuvC/YqgF family)